MVSKALTTITLLMTGAFDPDLLTVDPIGDHPNILSLEFPVVWAAESFVSKVAR
jgi:hypothetical protein